MKTSEFYDLRGTKALKKTKRDIGHHAIEPHVAFPYIAAENLMISIGPQKEILDFCCGVGLHSVFFAKQGLKVQGVDLSKLSIDAALGLAEEYSVSSLCKFENSNAEAFLSRGTTYDGIFISGSIYYFDLPRIVHLLNKALRPGGALVCVETYADNPFMALLRRLRKRLLADRDDATVSKLLGRSEIKTLKSLFEGSLQVKYFDFLTLAGVFFKPIPPFYRFYLKLSSRLDDWLLNGLKLHFLAFKFVVYGVKK